MSASDYLGKKVIHDLEERIAESDYTLISNAGAERHGSVEATFVKPEDAPKLDRYVVFSFTPLLGAESPNSAHESFLAEVWVGADDGTAFTRRLVAVRRGYYEELGHALLSVMEDVVTRAQGLTAQDLDVRFSSARTSGAS